MRKTLSLVIFNVIILAALIGLLEIFARLSEHFTWHPKDKPLPYVTKQFLPLPDIEKKYGRLEIPQKYKADSTYNWAELTQAKYKDEFAQAKYPKHYFDGSLRRANFSNQHIKVISKTNKTNTTVYDVVYDFNEHGLRTVKQSPYQKYTEYFVALGCSLTFGEGVPNGSDYPSQLANKSRQNIRFYNYGFSGAGPNDFYQAIIEDKKFFSAIKENKGTAAWLFIPDHLDRLFCSTNCEAHRPWILDKAHLELKNHQILYRNKFKDSHTPQRLFYRFLSLFHLLDYFNFSLPLEYANEDVELFVQTFLSIKKKLEEKTHLNKFIFINYAQFPQQNIFLQALQVSGINVIDYSDIPFYSLSSHQLIPIDGHSTSEFNWILSEMLAQDLNLKN